MVLFYTLKQKRRGVIWSLTANEILWETVKAGNYDHEANKRKRMVPSRVLNTPKRIIEVEISGSNVYSFFFFQMFSSEYMTWFAAIMNLRAKWRVIRWNIISIRLIYSSARHVQKKKRNQLCFLWGFFFSLKTEKNNLASLYPKCHFDVERARTHRTKRTYQDTLTC